MKPLFSSKYGHEISQLLLVKASEVLDGLFPHPGAEFH